MAAHIYCMISERSALTLKNPKPVTGKEMRNCDINTSHWAPGKHRHVELRKLQSRGPKAHILAALTEADFSLSLKLIKPAEIASPNGLNEIFN